MQIFPAFSETGCLIKVKELSLLYYLPIVRSMLFPKASVQSEREQSCFKLRLPISFPTMITATLSLLRLPNVMLYIMSQILTFLFLFQMYWCISESSFQSGVGNEKACYAVTQQLKDSRLLESDQVLHIKDQEQAGGTHSDALPIVISNSYYL